MDRPAIRRDCARREQRTWRLIHERHEFVRESRHRTSDANPTDIGTPADASHPTALPDVALHHWAPAAELHNALNRSVFLGEFGLLVVAAAVASFVHRLSE